MYYKIYTKISMVAILLATILFTSCSARKRQVLQHNLTTSITEDIALFKETLAPVLAPAIDSLTLAKDKLHAAFELGRRKDLSWVPAIHGDLRKPNYVIIHHTAQETLAQTIRTFTLPHTKVSAHYIIGKNGEVVQMLNDYERAWHAGAGKWGSITDLNSVSLGIELDNNGFQPFPTAQIDALLTLLDTIKVKYGIPAANFIGHADIAPTRKNDPSTLFPWEQLASRGFGIWYDLQFLETAPDSFNTTDALRIIGYDTRNLKAAIIAFKRKFIRKDLSPELTVFDKSVLYNIYKKL